MVSNHLLNGMILQARVKKGATGLPPTTHSHDTFRYIYLEFGLHMYGIGKMPVPYGCHMTWFSLRSTVFFPSIIPGTNVWVRLFESELSILPQGEWYKAKRATGNLTFLGNLGDFGISFHANRIQISWGFALQGNLPDVWCRRLKRRVVVSCFGSPLHT